MICILFIFSGSDTEGGTWTGSHDEEWQRHVISLHFFFSSTLFFMWQSLINHLCVCCLFSLDTDWLLRIWPNHFKEFPDNETGPQGLIRINVAVNCGGTLRLMIDMLSWRTPFHDSHNFTNHTSHKSNTDMEQQFEKCVQNLLQHC